MAESYDVTVAKKLRDLEKRFDKYAAVEIPLAGSVTATKMNYITLFGSPTGAVTFYEKTNAGLVAALAAATAGSMVQIPPCDITGGPWTVPSDVLVYGMGGKSILRGQVILSANSGLFLTVISNSGTGSRYAVVAPSSGSAYIRDCTITANSSDGLASTFSITTGNIYAYGCTLTGTGSTYGYIFYVTSSGNGYLYHCKITQTTSIAYITPSIVPTPGGKFYSDEGMSLLPSTTPGVVINGHIDQDNGAFTALYIDISFSPSLGDLYLRLTRSGIDPATVQRYYSDNGSDWSTYGSGQPMGIEYNGTYFNWGMGANHRYWALVKTSGASSSINFAYAYVNEYSLVTPGSVYVQACSGDTDGAVPLLGDRSAFDATDYASLHANDIDTVGGLHHTELDTLKSTGITANYIPVADGSDGIDWVEITADIVATDTTDFNRILSGADTDVQKALDTIDNEAAGINLANTFSDIQTVPAIQFDTTPTVVDSEGLLYWNVDRQTLNLVLPNGVILQEGQELYHHVINLTGSDIPNGSVVMYDGALGASGIIKCKLAVADGTYPSIYMMGVATEDIANGDTGKVTFFGEVRNFDTSGWAAGTVLYIDPTTPGGLTDTLPEAPNIKYAIAATLDSKNNGTLLVRAIFGLALRELDDVEIDSMTLANQDLLMYDTINLRWQNVNVSDLDVNIFKTHYEILQDSNGAILTDSNEIDILYVEVEN